MTSLQVNNSILKPKTKSERATVGFLTLFTGVDNANFSFDAFFAMKVCAKIFLAPTDSVAARRAGCKMQVLVGIHL